MLLLPIGDARKLSKPLSLSGLRRLLHPARTAILGIHCHFDKEIFPVLPRADQRIAKRRRRLRCGAVSGFRRQRRSGALKGPARKLRLPLCRGDSRFEERHKSTVGSPSPVVRTEVSHSLFTRFLVSP